MFFDKFDAMKSNQWHDRMHKLILQYSNTDFPTIPHTTLTKGGSYTRNLTSKKHTISTFADQTYIQITRKHRENAAFKTIGLPLNVKVRLALGPQGSINFLRL